MYSRIIIALLITLLTYNVNSQNAFYQDTNNSKISQDNEYFIHTVERGQTIYSISKMYGVSEDAIYKLNPGSDISIQIGSQLKIPQSSQHIIFHTIEPKETLYSVSKKYNVAGEAIIEANPGLSIQTFIIGRTIRIPVYEITSRPDTIKEEQTNDLLFQKSEIKRVKAVNISFLMPFGITEKTNPANLQSKVVEYYEGFLMALDSLKKIGISVNLNVVDIGNGTDILKNRLYDDDLKKANLIIGGVSDAQIKTLSEFSNKNKIPYIVPFASKCDEILNNPYLFQINTPASYLYSKASKAFINKYRNYNIILLSDNKVSEKADFIQALKSDMNAEKIKYSTISLTGSFIPEMDEKLSRIKQNIIVPTSGTQEFLSKVLSELTTLKQVLSFQDISLFGYPEWQTYDMGELSDPMYQLNTTIYSNFYTLQTDMETRNFYKKFYAWYSRPINNSFPKFSLLGYDTGMFFIQNVNQYGADFSDNINKLKYRGLQTSFLYQRVNNWGGFVNLNVFFVTYRPDFSIIREVK